MKKAYLSILECLDIAIYFKQIIRSSRDASGDGSTGYTNIDEPEPVDIIDEPEPVDAR